MNLYAIEHPDGGKWLYKWHTEDLDNWRDHLSEDTLLFDGDLAAKHAKDFGGTVVTFTLTRKPELKVGARVVPIDQVGVITDTGLDDEDDCTPVARLDGDEWLPVDELIVLPEEVEP